MLPCRVVATMTAVEPPLVSVVGINFAENGSEFTRKAVQVRCLGLLRHSGMPGMHAPMPARTPLSS